MSNRILSYRGLLADGAQDTILLSTKKGEVGYRIIKFDLIPEAPGAFPIEAVMQIWKTEQSSIVGTIDFSNQTLLGAGYFSENDATHYPASMHIMFDQEIFNQDIYITMKDVDTGRACNYYLELEVIKLDESQAMVATLEDIRNNS